jgi:hypothetical protein
VPNPEAFVLLGEVGLVLLCWWWTPHTEHIKLDLGESAKKRSEPIRIHHHVVYQVIQVSDSPPRPGAWRLSVSGSASFGVGTGLFSGKSE